MATLKNLTLEMVEWYLGCDKKVSEYQNTFEVSGKGSVTLHSNKSNERLSEPTYKVTGDPLLIEKLEELDEKFKKRPKIFIVYGRAERAKCELIEILKQYHFEPVLIEENIDGCEEISRRLKELVSESLAGIVLATPDDIGFLAQAGAKLSYRWRQNVVLEFGMLLALKDQGYTTILSQESSNYELEVPSDIKGLFRTSFRESVVEAKEQLLKRLFNYYGIKKLSKKGN